MVILDVSLPDGSGFELCRSIRQTSKIPIMFLTAADEEPDIIMGLDIGGDDYITKLFKLAVFFEYGYLDYGCLLSIFQGAGPNHGKCSRTDSEIHCRQQGCPY